MAMVPVRLCWYCYRHAGVRKCLPRRQQLARHDVRPLHQQAKPLSSNRYWHSMLVNSLTIPRSCSINRPDGESDNGLNYSWSVAELYIIGQALCGAY